MRFVSIFLNSLLPGSPCHLTAERSSFRWTCWNGCAAPMISFTFHTVHLCIRYRVEGMVGLARRSRQPSSSRLPLESLLRELCPDRASRRLCLSPDNRWS